MPERARRAVSVGFLSIEAPATTTLVTPAARTDPTGCCTGMFEVQMEYEKDTRTREGVSRDRDEREGTLRGRFQDAMS